MAGLRAVGLGVEDIIVRVVVLPILVAQHIEGLWQHVGHGQASESSCTQQHWDICRVWLPAVPEVPLHI